MNLSLIQKLLFLHRKSSKPQEAKNEKIEISLENGKFDNFVDNGLEAGDGGGRPEEEMGPRQPDPRADIAHNHDFFSCTKKSLIFEIQIFRNSRKLWKMRLSQRFKMQIWIVQFV